MSKDSESIDQIFQLHEEESKSASRKLNIVRTGTEKNETSRKIGEIHIPTGKLTPEERAWASEQAAEEQEVPNLHYHPIQQRDDNQTGCQPWCSRKASSGAKWSTLPMTTGM